MTDEPDLGGLSRIAAELRAAVADIDRADPLVLIDGRSGSGKSTLARMLQTPGTELLAMDDIYPGWDGLAAASGILATDILAPRAAGEPGSWLRWDWEAESFAEAHELAAGTPLIVEGAGSVTPSTAPLADVTVWLDAPTALRRDRALARDGETYAPHWDRWAAQERRHIEEHDPRALARYVYDVAEPSIAVTSPSSRYPSHS